MRILGIIGGTGRQSTVEYYQRLGDPGAPSRDRAGDKQRAQVAGLILGGTELSLILREPTAAGLPVLDTTRSHVEAAVEWML